MKFSGGRGMGTNPKITVTFWLGYTGQEKNCVSTNSRVYVWPG